MSTATSRPRRRGAPHSFLALLYISTRLLSPNGLAAAFSSPGRPHRHLPSTTPTSPTARHYSSPEHSPLEDEPWQADDSYWDMLQAASKDPETFEKFIEESMARRKGKATTAATASSSSSSVKNNNNGLNGKNATEEGTALKKKKYVPIEEWDARRKNGDNMSKEERLQWECQRGGDRFRQNEILRHNLKSF